MKKYMSVMMWATLLVGVSSWGTFAPASAQIDAFTFFIPYADDTLDDQLAAGYNGANLIGTDIETIISISVHRSGSIIYYDHWEDGLEPDLTLPVQPSTQVWGDNNPVNGVLAAFPTDTLSAGDVINLRNTITLDNAGHRDPNEIFFDGGDGLTSVGGAVAVTRTFWPLHNDPNFPGILYAVAYELYPTLSWGTDYVIPIGEDLAGLRSGFEVVGFNVQAVENGTTVQLDLNNDGTVDRTCSLNYGEQCNEISGVQTGARVQASAPVQVHVFSANPAGVYESRGYTLTPRAQWTNDYLAPRSSDGDFWLYNPDASTLDVEVQTITTSSVITVPANGIAKFPLVGLSTATGAHFTSTNGRPFYGVAAFDETDRQDWGDALIPTANLSTQALVGLGLGNNNVPPDGDQSRVYVTALSATTLLVDYDNDGTVDANFSIARLAETPITDPDHDLTGAFLFTDDGNSFVAVWGQDENAEPALPSIDVGISLIPLRSLSLQKVFLLTRDVDCTGTATPGDTVRFRLQFFNDSAASISNVVLEDNLPPAVTYLPHSTLLNGSAIPDAGATAFPLDEGGYNVGTVNSRSTGSLTFDTVINEATVSVTNRADIRSDLAGSDFALVVKPVEASAPQYAVKKTLIDPANGEASTGQTVSFGLTVINTGAIPITKLPLQDTFDATYLTFLNANPPPDTIAPGMISWNDLIPGLGGSLAPGAAVNLSVAFSVNSIAGATKITNTASAVGAELSGGIILPSCINTVALNLTSPPTRAPSDDDDDDEPPPTATPMPLPTPTAVAVAPSPSSVTPTVFPVSYLPETGSRSGKMPIMALLLLTLLAISAALLLLRQRSKRKDLF